MIFINEEDPIWVAHNGDISHVIVAFFSPHEKSGHYVNELYVHKKHFIQLFDSKEYDAIYWRGTLYAFSFHTD